MNAIYRRQLAPPLPGAASSVARAGACLSPAAVSAACSSVSCLRWLQPGVLSVHDVMLGMILSATPLMSAHRWRDS